MSEERGTYMGETPEDHVYKISDEAPHDYFSQIPNLVDELDLTPYAFRLYGHLRRVAGESGKCWQSTNTLATKCRMSAGMISQAKQELENTYPPLIRVESKTKDNGIYHEITITDIWAINHDFFTGVSVHLVKTPPKRSPSENPRSPSETKKNPVKEEPKDSLPSKKKDAVDFEIDYHLKPKAIKDAIAKHFKLTPNWEAKYNRQFLQWMIQNDATPEQVKTAAGIWGRDKRFNWSIPTLKGVQEHWFELIEETKETELILVY